MSIKRLNTVPVDREFETALRRDRVLKTLFAALRDVENRLRALEGRPGITEEQARESLKVMFTR